jgi:hypothetical protein
MSDAVETTEKPMKVIAGGSAAEALGGVAAVVLAIIGLSQVLPQTMAAIASIVVGVALVLEGAAILSRMRKLVPSETIGTTTGAELGGGVSAELLGGLAGIVLGALALADVAATALLPVAAIVFGAALLIGSTVISRINSMRVLGARPDDEYLRAASYTVNAAAGAQVLVAIASIVLGILGLLNIAPIVMSLVAFLSVGASVLLSGSAVGSKVLGYVSW